MAKDSKQNRCRLFLLCTISSGSHQLSCWTAEQQESPDSFFPCIAHLFYLLQSSHAVLFKGRDHWHPSRRYRSTCRKQHPSNAPFACNELLLCFIILMLLISPKTLEKWTKPAMESIAKALEGNCSLKHFSFTYVSAWHTLWTK